MNLKVFIILVGYFLPTIVTLFISCSDCGPFPNKFKVTSIVWNTFKVTKKDDRTEFFEIRDGVMFNQLGIRLNFQTESYFSFKKNNYSFTSSLYACSPADPTTNERILNIEINSNKDFSEEYPTGNDLSGLFDVLLNNGIKHDLKEYLKTKPFIPNELTLILKNAPILTDEYKFTIKYYQDGVDLNYSEFTTNNILVMK